jgi:hypothetical protein
MTETLTRIARWPVLLVVLLIGLAVLYRYGPDRRAARWQWVSVGSVFAAVTWIAGWRQLPMALSPGPRPRKTNTRTSCPLRPIAHGWND